MLDTAGQLKSDEIKIDGGIRTTTCGETETGSLDITNKGVPVIGTDNRFDDKINAPQLPKSADKIVVGTTVNFTQDGGLSVGHDKYDSSKPEATIGSLIFGEDSVTVLNTQTLQGAAAFNTDDSMKVFVEDGAVLILGNVDNEGRQYVTTGFDVAQMDGWLDSDHLYALDEDGSGLNWLLTVGNDPTNIWVDVVRQKAEEVYIDVVIPENTNEGLKDGEGADYDFISHTIKNGDFTVEDKTQAINSVATLAAGIGVTRMAIDDANEASDADPRMSLNSDFAGVSRAKAKVKTNVLTAGVQGEARLPVNQSLFVVPHIGARLISTHTSDNMTKLDGKSVFKNSTDSTTTLQTPIGVSVRGNITQGAWTVEPTVDVGIIPQIGNTKVFNRVTGVAMGVNEDVVSQFGGKFGS